MCRRRYTSEISENSSNVVLFNVKILVLAVIFFKIMTIARFLT